MERKAFLDQEPPPGYIAGIGRGATGFVTQADLGSVNLISDSTYRSIVNDVNKNRSTKGAQISAIEQEEIDADTIYDEIEKRLAAKRGGKKRKVPKNVEAGGDDAQADKKHVEARNDTVSENIAQISEQFIDAKKELAKITEEQWEQLPESGDFTRRNKRLRAEFQEKQRSYRNSDMIALGMRDAGATDLSLMDMNEHAEIGNETNGENDTTSSEKVDIFEISRVKDRLFETQLQLKKEKATDTFDRDSYLHQLQPAKSSQYNIGDYKKTRKLLAKLRETVPNDPQNWIASARLEFDAKKFKKAREIIQKGCEICPKSEEAWLTNLEMNEDDVATSKVVVAEAIRFHHKSTRLWLKAANLEQDNISKQRILRKALEILPKNPELWLAMVDYENSPVIAAKILEKALSILPDSKEVLLKLSSVQDKSDAIQTLINGMVHLEREDQSSMWIIVAKLEEEHSGNELKVGKYVGNAIFDTDLDLEKWFSEAENCESDGYPMTCRAVVIDCLSKRSIDLPKILEDAQKYHEKGHHIISEAIISYATENYPQDINVWETYLKFKKDVKDYKEMFLIYEMAISSNPTHVDFYISYVKDKINFDLDIYKIRSILSEASEKNSKEEKLWMFIVDFEMKYGPSLQVANDVFSEYFKSVETPSIDLWLKKIKVERQAGFYELALETSSNALTQFPKEASFYVEKGLVLHSMKMFDAEQEVYELGIKRCKNNEKLYINLSEIFSDIRKNLIKARSVLETALSHHSKSENLYHVLIHLEISSNNKDHAMRLLSKALSLIPDSPLLWCDSIKFATKQQAKSMFALALKKTGDHPLIILTIARNLWKQGKLDRVPQFLKACLEKDADFGDAYLYYYAFLLRFGEKEDIENLENLFLERSQLHGELWEKIETENWRYRASALTMLRESAASFSKSNSLIL